MVRFGLPLAYPHIAKNDYFEPPAGIGEWLSIPPLNLNFNIGVARCILKLRSFHESNPRK
jgi:hypothetical protein